MLIVGKDLDSIVVVWTERRLRLHSENESARVDAGRNETGVRVSKRLISDVEAKLVTLRMRSVSPPEACSWRLSWEPKLRLASRGDEIAPIWHVSSVPATKSIRLPYSVGARRGQDEVKDF